MRPLEIVLVSRKELLVVSSSVGPRFIQRCQGRRLRSRESGKRMQVELIENHSKSAEQEERGTVERVWNGRHTENA